VCGSSNMDTSSDDGSDCLRFCTQVEYDESTVSFKATLIALDCKLTCGHG
jgi:hypothetical protein